MPCCCAVGCKNRSEKGFRMFRFPANENRKKIWLAKIRRESWLPTPHSRVCEVHFDSTQFESNRLDGRKLLKPFAIPEIFPHRTFKSARKPPARRPISSIDKDAEDEDNPKYTEPIAVVESPDVDHSSGGPVEELAEQTSHSSGDEKDDIIRRLKSQVSSLQRKVKKLEACLEETTRSIKSLFNPDELQSLGKQCNKGLKWSNTTIRKALQIRFACGIKGYNCLRNLGYPLPSDRTLSRRLEEFKFRPGIIHEVFDFLKLKVNLMKESERFCVLLLDEMVIEERVELDRSTKTLFGYTTLPNAETVATHALVFMLAGVATRWKQIVAYHFTGSSFPSLEAKNIILNIIKMCHDIDLNVICITCDMGSCNRAIWKEFGIVCGKLSRTMNYIPHPCRAGCNIYFMADVCHVLKNIRNHLLDDKCLYLSDEIVKRNGLRSGKISLEPVKKLVELQAGRDIKIVPRLTEQHVFVKQYQKMRVRTAKDLLSFDVAAGIKYCVNHHGWNEEYLATAFFFEVVDKWFSLMCSRHPVMAISKHQPDIYDKSIDFLKNSIEIFQGLKVGDGTWKPVQTGVKLTTTSVLDLQDFLLNKCSFGYILTSRFCQDSLENLFSTVRVKNPIPSPVQFKNALKIISIAQFMIIPSRGNCDSDEGSLLADFLCVSGIRMGDNEEELNETSLSCGRELRITDIFNDNSLYYLCGYIVRQLNKNLQCSMCENILCGDGSDIPAGDKELLLLKERKDGSLVRSSKWCWDLSKEAECIFLAHKNILPTLQFDIVEFLCNQFSSAHFVNECHDIKGLFLKKYFLLRMELHAKALSAKYKKTSVSMGHGSRSVHMRKLI